jgi:hypothetical protein
VRQRWLSRRALLLHLALAIWFPGCLVAFWWQVHRAFSGNGLSYLYSVEWPVFALTGIWAWWQLVHTDPDSVGRRAQQRMAAERASHTTTPPGPDGPETADGVAGATTDGATGTLTGAGPGGQPLRRREDEDPELAAYNDRLARLATEGPGTWRRR